MTVAIGTRPAKNDLFDGFSRVAASMAAGRRLEIVDILAQAPRTVEELARSIGQSVANTSHHLRRMAGDGLVRSRKEGRHAIYELASRRVYDLLRAIQDVAATHHDGLAASAAAYLGDRSEIRVIDQATLRQRMRRGEVVVLDVRPRAEYDAGHIEGAVWAPAEKLDRVLADLPDSLDIVAYCRGEYCANADRAVRRLQAEGRTAYRLEAGYPEWESGRA